jgi:hypothetical protein
MGSAFETQLARVQDLSFIRLWSDDNHLERSIIAGGTTHKRELIFKMLSGYVFQGIAS